jgi:signal transduction histidine kinase
MKPYWSESFFTVEERELSGHPKTLVGTTMRIDQQKEIETALTDALYHAEESDRLKSAFLSNISHEIRTPLNAIVGFSNVLSMVEDKEERQSLVKTIQQKLRKETVRAEDSGRLKAAFLANMTHEIRTPLNAIVGFSDVLQMVDAGDERMEMIRIIRSNCDMLLRLINDILEASSMGQSLLIQPEDIDVPRVFDDICITLAQRVENVPFIKDNPLKTYPARLDKGRLQQMLTNFTTNAVKYTHEGHIKVGWRPEERNGQEGLYFYCEDTGAGIPKDKQSAVFERFVKLNDFVQGTGLGLSICKAIIDRSGGEIGVTSDGEGCGSTFWFWIPRH